MAESIKYVVTGSKRAADAMRAFADKASNLEEVGPEIHDALTRSHVRIFKTQGREGVGQWPGYTGQEAVYGFIKREVFGIGPDRLLRWEPGNERLFPSVVSQRHPEHVWRIKDGEFEFGTSVPYARHHQEGSGRGPAWAGFPKIKKRVFLTLTRSTAAEVTRIIRKHMGL